MAGVQWIDKEEMEEILDNHARELLGISGRTFITRRNRGYYDKIDCRENPGVVFLCMLAPQRKLKKGK